MTVKKKTDGENEKQILFSKEQMLESKRYTGRKDLLNALLEDGEKYTISEIDEKINKFMKGQVK